MRSRNNHLYQWCLPSLCVCGWPSCLFWPFCFCWSFWFVFFLKKKECSCSLLICLRLFCLLTELTCRRLYLAHHFGSSMSGHVNLDFCSFSFYISLSLSFPLFLFFSLFVFVFFLGRPLISSRQDHLLGSIFFWNLVFVFFFGGCCCCCCCCCCCFLFSLFLFISLRPQCVNAAPYPQQIT